MAILGGNTPAAKLYSESFDEQYIADMEFCDIAPYPIAFEQKETIGSSKKVESKYVLTSNYSVSQSRENGVFSYKASVTSGSQDGRNDNVLGRDFRGQNILITGAAGNLGTLSSRRLSAEDVKLRLLVHRHEVAEDLLALPNVSVARGDLAQPDTLRDALEGIDTVIHFAGVLFKPNPGKFLAVTNVEYFRNLLDVAIEQGVRRVILISFPHVEGATTPSAPATGRLDAEPVSVHARTRLEEERLLFKAGQAHGIEAVSLRVGMVYGRGILMIDAAQWFARHWLLGVWREPTWIHLISAEDFTSALTAATLKPDIHGIYHIGDEGVQTLQEFLDEITRYRGNRRPWRMPVWMIMTAAFGFECFSAIFGTRSPLTRDFIRIGRVSYYGDTSRMRSELLPELKYKTFREGIEII